MAAMHPTHIVLCSRLSFLAQTEFDRRVEEFNRVFDGDGVSGTYVLAWPDLSCEKCAKEFGSKHPCWIVSLPFRSSYPRCDKYRQPFLRSRFDDMGSASPCPMCCQEEMSAEEAKSQQ